MEFHILTKPDCPYCIAAKDLLTKLGHSYSEVAHVTDDEKKSFKAKGYKTYPQIFYDGELIGGYDNLQTWLIDRC